MKEIHNILNRGGQEFNAVKETTCDASRGINAAIWRAIVHSRSAAPNLSYVFPITCSIR